MAQTSVLPFAFPKPTLAGDHDYPSVPRNAASSNAREESGYDTLLFNLFGSPRPSGVSSTSTDYHPGQQAPLTRTVSSSGLAPTGQSMAGANTVLEDDQCFYLPSGADWTIGDQISDSGNFNIAQNSASGSSQSQLVQRTRLPKARRGVLAEKELKPHARSTRFIACLICTSEHVLTILDGLDSFLIHIQTAHLPGVKTGKTKKNKQKPCPCPWPECAVDPSCAGIMRHMQAHANIKLKCTQCTKVVSRDDLLQKHVRESNNHDVNIISWDEIQGDISCLLGYFLS